MVEQQTCQAELPDTDLHQGPCPYAGFNLFEYEGKHFCILHLPESAKTKGPGEETPFSLVEFDRNISEIAATTARKNQKNARKLASDFRGVVFPAEFSPQKIKHSASSLQPTNFAGSVFLGVVDFANFHFDGEANFSKVDFREKASFSSTRSEHHYPISFEGAFFGRQANFSHANFEGTSNFSRANFCKGANFDHATLRQGDFSETNFTGRCRFEGTTFDQLTKFNGAKFVISREAQGNSKAHFHGATFNGEVSFVSVSFCSPVNFDSATFQNTANFLKAEFSFAPSILGTKFLEDVTFEKAKFEFGNEATFRKLKKLMENQGHMWEATVFYGRELSEQWYDLNAFNRLFSLNFLFWALNDYGRKWLLPLGWLVFVTAGFWSFFFFSDSMVIDPGEPRPGWEGEVGSSSRLFKALIFSLQNLKLTWLFGKKIILAKHIWVWLASGVQAIISVILIAMAVLSIRRRFKI